MVEKKQFSTPILIKIMTLHPKDYSKTLVSEITLSKLFYQTLKDKNKFIGEKVTKSINMLIDKEVELLKDKNGKDKKVQLHVEQRETNETSAKSDVPTK